MGMVLPDSPAVLDLRTGKVLGDPVPATRLDPLHLLAPPPVKPSEYDARASRDQGAPAGRNDHTHHGDHTGHTGHAATH
jgi:hypothetical protein